MALILVLAPLLGLVLTGLWIKWNLGRENRRLQQAARERGEPLTLAEIERALPLVHATTNPAVALLELWRAEDSNFWSAFMEGRRPLGSRRPVDGSPDLPLLGTKRDSLEITPSAPLPPKARAVADRFLATNQSRFVAVRRALRRGPVARYPVRLKEGLSALLPHLVAIEEEVRRFRLATLVAVDDGRTSDALDSMETTLLLPESLAADPLLIAHLVRLRIYHSMLDDLERLLSHGPPSADVLRRMARLVDRLSMADAERRSFIAERAMILEVIENPSTPQLEGGELTLADVKMAATLFRLGEFAFGYLAAERRLSLRTFDRLLRLADAPLTDRLLESKTIFADFRNEAAGFPPKVLCGLLIPALERASIKFGTLEARRGAARAALALEEFRAQRQGSLPSDLPALVPTFLAAIPIDPFSGKAMAFRTRERGFVVYSVGEDGQDDEGKVSTDRRQRSGYDVTFTVER